MYQKKKKKPKIFSEVHCLLRAGTRYFSVSSLLPILRVIRSHLGEIRKAVGRQSQEVRRKHFMALVCDGTQALCFSAV